jgi:hypothetical protein
VIEQAAGSGDDDVDAAGQRLALWAMADAAEDGGDAEAEVSAIGLEAFGDLGGEFTRRREHERAAAAPAPALRSAARRWRIGRAKAAVLPVPVWAMPRRSRPVHHAGDGCELDRRGLRVALRFSASMIDALRFRSLNWVK